MLLVPSTYATRIQIPLRRRRERCADSRRISEYIAAQLDADVRAGFDSRWSADSGETLGEFRRMQILNDHLPSLAWGQYANTSQTKQSLPFQKVVHQVATFDAQPSSEGGGIIVMVTGALLVRIPIPLGPPWDNSGVRLCKGQQWSCA
jgi:hypothetical protein